MKNPPVPLSFIQRKAKQLKKENPGLKHHQALDGASKSFGHTNFKNYKNEHAAYDSWFSAQLERGADFAMNEQSEKMAERLSVVDPIFQNFKVPIIDLISVFKNKIHTNKKVQAVCEKESSLKEYLELYFLWDSLDNIDWDLVTFAPYHIPHQASLKKLIYKYGRDEFDEPTDTELLYVRGEYEIVCKIIFEHTQEDIDANKDGFFDDSSLTGFFELTIDKDKNITIGDLTGGSD